MKKFGTLIFLFALWCPQIFAQSTVVQGIIFDSVSKQRITRVYIYNTKTNLGVYNNTKGEFKIPADKGDILIAKLQGYFSDTVKVDNSTLLIYLKRTSIQLREVVIKDTVMSPAALLAQAKKDYNTIYRIGNNKDVLVVGNGLQGAGLGIDALYSMISRDGKNARYLQKIIARDYENAVIDSKYTKLLVSNITGLYGASLDDFMQQYRPTYYFVAAATEYTLITFIKISYRNYLLRPKDFKLPQLRPLVTDVNRAD